MQQKKHLRIWEIVVAVVFAGFISAIIVPMIMAKFYLTPTQQCLWNLRQIASALNMYYMDYKCYPETLGGYVQTDENGKTTLFKNAGSMNSLNAYIKDIKHFHCPSSKLIDTNAVVEINIDGKVRRYYAYDSYDVYTPGKVKGTVKVGVDSLRYNPSLKDMKNPTDDTVVTWCSYHVGLKSTDENEQMVPVVPVLFLDGHTNLLPTAQVEGAGGSRWSTKPKSY